MSRVTKAQATWKGHLADGEGSASLESSGLGPFTVNWTNRAESQVDKVTNPEELIGAGLASCFSMALANIVAEEGATPEQITTGADITFDPVKGIQEIHLVTVGRAEGIEQKTFQTLAEQAKKTCPAAKALSGVKITLSATMA